MNKNNRWLSREILVLKGVHQGNTLSRTLFSIVRNDITTAMNGNHSPSINNNTVQIIWLLYADDIIILSQTKTGLQNKLDRLCHYSDAWGLQINRDKIKVVILTPTVPIVKLFFKRGNDTIETTDSHKYLGVVKRELYYCPGLPCETSKRSSSGAQANLS